MEQVGEMEVGHVRQTEDGYESMHDWDDNEFQSVENLANMKEFHFHRKSLYYYCY